MNERAKRDRPAKNPGTLQCDCCDKIFIGEEWHLFCAVCVRKISDEIAEAQGLKKPSPRLAPSSSWIADGLPAVTGAALIEPGEKS